jgi:exonuclease III
MNELLTWGALIGASGSIIALIRLWMDLGSAISRAKEAAHDALMLTAKLDLLASNLADYKVQAASQFASYTALQIAENRFSNAVEGMRADFTQLTLRLDRLIERMDK